MPAPSASIDPARPSWLPVPDGSDFPITNLPFGVAAGAGGPARVVVAIGDHAVDLESARSAGLVDLPAEATTGSLDRLLADDALDAARLRAWELLTDPRHRTATSNALRLRVDLRLAMPFTVADFVDFYASETHATAVGRIFRPGDDPLPVAWRHLPIGYHGRAGTVVVSDTPIDRPWGQRSEGGSVVFAPSAQLDFELEVGAVVGRPSARGRPVAVEDALDHIAGFVLVNDWSARDIQGWEYQPLGPFLGKSFATTISPWLVTADALAPYRVPPPDQRPPAQAHLRPPGPAFDLVLEAEVSGQLVARASFAGMYWTVAQQVAHLTSNGAGLRTGDLLASGTVSDPRPGGAGCLLEATKGGSTPFHLPDGRALTWLEDGDTVALRGHAGHGPTRIGFGPCRGTVRPAHDLHRPPGGQP
jgi:fumarylacetoacetase